MSHADEHVLTAETVFFSADAVHCIVDLMVTFMLEHPAHILCLAKPRQKKEKFLVLEFKLAVAVYLHHGRKRAPAAKRDKE
ncbi:MAG: hypothetical protein WBD81_01685 [Collimonas pratensis]|uniref:hypothetical protein n=1 Tax=Collimonas pratensis TaxID=279113 RepID=UPI003C754E08